MHLGPAANNERTFVMAKPAIGSCSFHYWCNAVKGGLSAPAECPSSVLPDLHPDLHRQQDEDRCSIQGPSFEITIDSNLCPWRGREYSHVAAATPNDFLTVGPSGIHGLMSSPSDPAQWIRWKGPDGADFFVRICQQPLVQKARTP